MQFPRITEKRTSERHNLVRDLKVFHPDGGRYLAGQTLNVSDGGALLALRHGQYIEPGARVKVAIDWTGHQPVYRQEQMTEGKIVRNEGESGYACVVAVAFAERQAPRLAA
jgi:hypothetical protein